MIPTFIGVRFDPPNQTLSNVLQIWLEKNGLQAYTPQLMDGDSVNLSVEWNGDTGGLNWKPATVAHLARLSARDGLVMGMSFNGYFRGDHGDDSYKTVAWPDPKTGAMLDQDQLPLDVMTSYLKRSNQWLLDRKIKIWFMFDEPPHPGGIDGGDYGWTPQVETRTLKMGQALRGAGIPFGVCFPNYQSLKFWRSKSLAPDWYILNEKHDYPVYAPYLPKGAKVWVYNVRAVSLPRLAERLAEYGALGLVMWHAVPRNKNNQMPLLFDLSKTPPTPTEAAALLLAQLKAYTPGGTTPALAPALEEQVEALRKEAEALRQEVAALQQQAAALQQEAADLKRALAALQAEKRVYE